MPDGTFKDPLGRPVVLHDHTWYGHIIEHHPELRHHRRLVERAISDPDAIHHSPSDPDCRLFFGAGPRAGIMILVVVNIVRGFVKTAHLVKATKGALEWSKPTP